MQTIPLQQAIEQARANPTSEFAKKLRQDIESGKLDQVAQKQGIDLSKYGRPTQQKENIIGTLINEPIKQLLVRPAARTAEAVGRTGILGENIKRGYEEMAAKGESQVFPTALGNIEVEQADSARQIGGEALQVASYLFPYGKAAKAMRPLVGKQLGNIASGAVGGYAADVGYGLDDESQTVGQALTPGLGTAIGAAIPGVGAVAQGTKPALRGAGRALQKAGELVTDVVLPTPAKEAQLLQAYKANKPFTERISDVLAGTEMKPRTVAKTALQTKEGQTLGGLFGTKSQIGVQARRASTELWDNLIKPRLDESGVAVDMDGFFSKIEKDIIENNPDITRQKALIEALDAVRKDYEGINAVSLTKLQDLKSSWAEFLPSKAFKGEEIAGSVNEVRRLLSDEARQTIYNTLGDDVKQAYLDYGNLQTLKDMGVSSMTGQKLKGGAGSFISELASQVITPIGTVAGQVIYRIGKGLEMIGKPGAKNLGELLNLKFPGDAFLDSNMGKSLKKNVSEYIENPKMGLSIEDISKKGKGAIPQTTDELTTSIQQAKASGQSFDEWVNGQATELNYKNLQENDYSIKAYGKDFNEPVEYFRAGQVRKNGDIWLTDNEAGAMQYSSAGGGTKVRKYIVQSRNPLIIDTAGGKYAKGNIDINKILTKEEIAQGYTNNPDTKKKFIDYAKNNGYDAVQFGDSFPDGEGGMRSLVVWNKDALKTRSQLKAEWDKVKTSALDAVDSLGLTPTMKDNIVEIIDDFRLNGAKNMELQQDASRIAEELGIPRQKTYGALVNRLQKLLEESDKLDL